MSMQSVASPVYTFIPPRRNSLTHIPGDEGWPLIGKTLDVLADPKGQVERSSAKYGLCYRSHLFGETSLVMLGPEANELVLFDQAKQFSSTLGWGRILGLLFPRGLMLLDFEEHRLHRRALSVAFKSGPMKSYLAELDTGIAARVAQWKAQPGPMLFYPAMKQLTLDLAATSFLGAGIGPEVDEITRAFVDMVAASVAVIRKPLPGTPMARGVKGRKRIVAYFSEQIPLRRAKGGGDDLFSQLCQATHEDGALLSTQDIVDHMSFLMMAAHDTLTSSLTSFVGELAAHPEWQQKLRDEVKGLGLAADAPTTFDNLEAMHLTEMAFKEALRLKPPVPSMPRRAIRDFTFKGYAIPAGAMVGINPLFTHHMPDIWSEPEKFDPMRFTDEAQRNRHRFAWVPYGGGAHMCLGLHFAYMQAKCFARHFLQNLEVSLEPGYKPDWQMWPIPKPRDGLRVVLRTL
jgi:cytochrome P450